MGCLIVFFYSGKKSGQDAVMRGDAGLKLHVIEWMSTGDETHLVLRDAYLLREVISILAPLCPTVKHFSIDFRVIRLIPFTLMPIHMSMRSVITVCIKSVIYFETLQETLLEVSYLFPNAESLDMQMESVRSPSDQPQVPEVNSSSSLRELKLRCEDKYSHDVSTDSLFFPNFYLLSKHCITGVICKKSITHVRQIH